MSEQFSFEETESTELTGFGTAMDGGETGGVPSKIINEKQQTITEAEQLINRTPGSDLFSVKQQADNIFSRFSDVLMQVSPYLDSRQNGPGTVSQANKLHNEIEAEQQKLQEFMKGINSRICEEGLARGNSVISKVTAFLYKDPVQEKRKDKRAYYDTCDNYSRLCEGLATDLAQSYKPCADNANLSAELDQQIETLIKCKNALDARF